LQKRSFEPGTCPAEIASEDAATNFYVQFFTPYEKDFNVNEPEVPNPQADNTPASTFIQ
jgi:hypothetical protein